MRIEIPNHKAISWNKLYEQGHWSKRKQLVDEVHDLVWAYMPKGKKMFEGRVDISVTGYFEKGYHRDPDNICAKLYIDGLKGRVLEDDDERFVRRVTTEAITGAEEDKVVIEITKVGDKQ